MRAASNRGLSARTIALGSVAVLAGLAAINRQRALDALKTEPKGSRLARFEASKLSMGGVDPYRAV